MSWRNPTEEELAIRKQVLEEYPFLVSFDQWGKRISAPALGAKNIKRLLKHHYPTVKFDVKSDRYSGGSSINIHWEIYGDAPSTKDVNRLVKHLFSYARFDGQTDTTEYDDDIYRNQFRYVFGDAAHVSARGRDIEPEELARRDQEKLQKQTVAVTPARRGPRL